MCAPKVGTGSNEPKKGFGRCDHLVALSLLGPYGHVLACSLLIQQILANNSGISLPSDTYVPKPGNMEKNPFDGSTGGAPRAHPGLSLRRDTVMDMRTELNAACHTAGWVTIFLKNRERGLGTFS